MAHRLENLPDNVEEDGVIDRAIKDTVSEITRVKLVVQTGDCIFNVPATTKARIHERILRLIAFCNVFVNMSHGLCQDLLRRKYSESDLGDLPDLIGTLRKLIVDRHDGWLYINNANISFYSFFLLYIMEELSQKYKAALIASRKLPIYKSRLLQEMERHGIKSYPIRDGSGTIQYNSYKDKEGITQRLLRDVLASYYPDLNPDKFIRRVSDTQQHRIVNTLVFKDKL